MMDNDRFIALTQHWIDGTLSDAEARELHAAITESAERREQLRAQSALHAVLERRYRRKNGSVNRRVRAALRDPSQKKGAITRIMEKLAAKKSDAAPSNPPENVFSAHSRKARRARHFFFGVAAAIAVGLLASIALYLHFAAKSAQAEREEALWAVPPGTPTVASAKPDAGVATVRRGEKTLQLKKTRPLIAGDIVSTAVGDTVALDYPDKTHVAIPGSTTLSLQPAVLQNAAGIGIDLTSGEIDAEVAHQPAGKPMIVLTPQGRAVIVGTHFKLSAAAAQSKLDVAQGSVRFDSSLTKESVLVAQGETAVLARGMALEAAPSARDPALWPFSEKSPWNYPLGSGAKFAPVDSPRFDLTKGVGTVIYKNAIPIYIAAATDPERTFYRTDKTVTKTLRLPKDAAPDPSEFKYMNVIDERHATVYELLGVNVQTDGTIRLDYNSYYNSLRHMGVFSDNKRHGSRIYGGSSMGGIIRKGELDHGIRHAVSIAVAMNALNQNAPGGRPFVWPASNAIAEWETKYGQTGNLHLGSMLAIPPDVDLRTLGVGTSGPVFEIARALQDYGAYVVDHFDAAEVDVRLFFEPVSTTEFAKGLSVKLAPVFAKLKVVTNNSATNIGGGGALRRQLAPPFAKEFVEKPDNGGQF